MEENAVPIDRDDFDRHLGAMVREAAVVDMLMILLCQYLVASPHGALLIAGENTSRVQNILKTFIEARDDLKAGTRGKLRILLDRSRPLFNQRHSYVHGPAIPDEYGGLTMLRTRRLNAGYQPTRINLRALEQLTNDFQKLGFDISQTFGDVIAEVEGHNAPGPLFTP